MKKELVATISSSISFYNEEAERLDLPKWSIFSTIYELEILPLAMVYLPLSPEETTKELETLMKDHKAKIAKSDYLIVINKDNYIGESVTEEIAYADENGVGILYTEYDSSIEYIGSIEYNGHTLYLRAPNLHYMEDTITQLPTFKLSEGLKKIKLAAIPDVPNVNGYTYSKEEIKKAMSSNRIMELIETGSLGVEYGSSTSKCASVDMFIDLQFVVGTVVLLGSNYLFIKPNKKFDEVFAEDEYILAYMRYIVSNLDVDNRDLIIINWDIHLNELPEGYLDTIS